MPATISYRALAAAGIGSQLLVWDNELDDTIPGTLVEYDPRGWPMFVVDVVHEYPAPCGERGYGPDGTVCETTRVQMAQGAYTDNGRFRVVEIVKPATARTLVERALLMGDCMPTDPREALAFLHGVRRTLEFMALHPLTPERDAVRVAVDSAAAQCNEELEALAGDSRCT